MIDGLLQFVADTWGPALVVHAWDDFWNYNDVPEDMVETPEFEPMFIPWLVLGFVPDPHAEDGEPDWPSTPIGLHWLATEGAEASEEDRAYIETVCRTPTSVFAVAQLAPGRSMDLKDVLTGRRFHVLEQTASRSLRQADLIFARVVTLDGISVTLGMAPYIAPPSWHVHVIEWREQQVRRRLMTTDDLLTRDIEIRELYFEITDALLNPQLPQINNTDGDPIALTTLTYQLSTSVADACEKLAPLAAASGDADDHDVVRDDSGAVVSATVSWTKTGNRQHTHWDNTILGTLRLEDGRLVCDVNSTRRANRLKREITKRLGDAAVLIDTSVTDPFEAAARQVLEGAAGDTDSDRPPDVSEEMQVFQEEALRAEWRAWLDMRVPALKNKTPRQAIKTVQGRERLEALLTAFDRQAETGPPGAAQYVEMIREALGVPKSGGRLQ